MNIKATAGRGQGMGGRCSRLELRPDNADEADMLARLYRTMMFGGQVQIRRGGVDPYVVEFPGNGKESA